MFKFEFNPEQLGVRMERYMGTMAVDLSEPPDGGPPDDEGGPGEPELIELELELELEELDADGQHVSPKIMGPECACTAIRSAWRELLP